MGKIKVDKRVFEALEEAKYFLGSENYGKYIIDMYHKGDLIYEESDSLENTLWKYDISEVFEILTNGYELEEQIEDKIKKYYDAAKEEAQNKIIFGDIYYFNKGVMRGIEIVLGLKGEKIKGIEFFDEK